MHHLPSLLSKCSLQVKIFIVLVFKNVSVTIISHFQGRLAYLTPTLIKSKHKLFFSLQFRIVRMHALDTLFSSISLQFRIVSNTIRMHALETLCSLFFSAVPKCFKYLQDACFRYISIFLWLYFVVESLHYFKKKCIFSPWQTQQNIKLLPSKYPLKCPKMQLRQYRMSKLSKGHAPYPP